MCCILCLESAGPTANVIVNTTEGQLCIWCVLEKYFSWLKVTSFHNADICVCRQCWDALFTFHQFYVQVERAHKILKCDLIPTGNCVPAERLPLAEAAALGGKDTEAAIAQLKKVPETEYSEVVKGKCKWSPPRKKKLLKECSRLTKASQKRATTANKQIPKDVELYDPVVKDKNLDVVGTLNAVEALHAGKLSEVKEEPAETFDDDMEFISETNDPEKQPIQRIGGDDNLERYVLGKDNPAALREFSKREDRSAYRRRSGVKCSIPNCNKSKRSNIDLKLFKFPPADLIMGKIWREKCNISPDCDDYNKNLYICHNHFRESDIGKRFLKRFAVPMFFN